MPEPPEHISPTHETRDINATAVGCFGIALAIGLGAIFLLLSGMLARLGERHPANSAATRITGPPLLPPEPRLQSNPTKDFDEFRQQQNAILDSYGWVDRPAGVVRIPIERAMDLVAQRGLPAPPGSANKTPLDMRQQKASAVKSPQ
jgi:hypothetical protein